MTGIHNLKRPMWPLIKGYEKKGKLIGNSLDAQGKWAMRQCLHARANFDDFYKSDEGFWIVERDNLVGWRDA